MKSPQQREFGIVAILDALGAANYTDPEIQTFLESRENVLRLFIAKADEVIGDLRADMISTFTFNDTILILLKSGASIPKMAHVRAFHTILRKFMIDSLSHRILFRGALSIGSFYVNDDTNTVMGQAVTDAAAWYDMADWFGLHGTPRASIVMERLISEDSKTSHHIVVDYDVPMKNQMSVRLKTLNWPKAFYVPSISPCVGDEEPRSKLLTLLSRHQIPFGVEKKFFNAIAFFDFIVKFQNLEPVTTGRTKVRTKRQK